MAQTERERELSQLARVDQSLNVVLEQLNLGAPNKLIQKDLKRISKNSGYPLERIQTRFDDIRREAALEANPLLETRQIRAKGGKASMKDQMKGLAISVAPVRVEEQETHTMPDGTVMPGATHGEYEEQMEGLMDKETPMLPDEEMEEDYVDHVVSSTLEEEDQNYLESALAEDAKLSEIFDQVVESASEFSGSGPIEGPGTEVSDSIPARLSDGEFVFTAKATDEIGEDNLMSMMKDAEAGADERQGVAYGGTPDEDKKADIAVSTQGSILAAGGIPPVVPMDPIREDQILSMQSSSPRRGYRTISG